VPTEWEAHGPLSLGLAAVYFSAAACAWVLRDPLSALGLAALPALLAALGPRCARASVRMGNRPAWRACVVAVMVTGLVAYAGSSLFAFQAAMVLAGTAALVFSVRGPIGTRHVPWVGGLLLLVVAFGVLRWGQVRGALGGGTAAAAALSLGLATWLVAVQVAAPRRWAAPFAAMAVLLVFVTFEADPGAVLPLSLGVLVGVAFAAAAYRVRALDGRGAVAGGLLAASVVGFGGVAWAVPSFVFFVLSSLLSRIDTPRKRAAGRVEAKGSRRDAGQVYANGGVGWFLLAGHVVWPERVLFLGFLGAFAAAAADTWATELGTLSHRKPRHILTGMVVPRGTSGAVSFVGTLAGVLGAAAVWGSAWLVAPAMLAPLGAVPTAVAVVAGGALGSLVDTLLGATLQARYRDAVDGAFTERPATAGRANALVSGYAWMDNDHVNVLGTLAGALVAMACFPVGFFAS
jgi:uncharacterized protein (TIGR00297 family)